MNRSTPAIHQRRIVSGVSLLVVTSVVTIATAGVAGADDGGPPPGPQDCDITAAPDVPDDLLPDWWDDDIDTWPGVMPMLSQHEATQIFELSGTLATDDDRATAAAVSFPSPATALAYDASRVDVRVPADPTEPATFEQPRGSYSMTTQGVNPAARYEPLDDGAVVLRDAKPDVDQIVHLSDSGAASTVWIMTRPGASNRMTYELTLGAGVRALPVDSGGVVLVDDTCDIVAQIMAPWALDADGTPLPTRYERTDIDDTTVALTQVVDVASDTSYPVFADPGNFADVAWEYIKACLTGTVIGDIIAPLKLYFDAAWKTGSFAWAEFQRGLQLIMKDWAKKSYWRLARNAFVIGSALGCVGGMVVKFVRDVARD